MVGHGSIAGLSFFILPYCLSVRRDSTGSGGGGGSVTSHRFWYCQPRLENTYPRLRLILYFFLFYIL